MNKNYIYHNANPIGRNTNDCVIRAISKALDTKWEYAKALVDACSMELYQSEDSDMVWFKILADRGFEMMPVFCKNKSCTLDDFCNIHKRGTYVVKLPNHVVCVVDGRFYDSFDSGSETTLYCWKKGN